MHEIDVGFDDEVAFSADLDVEDDDLLDVWRSARSLLPDTGRWPVVTTTLTSFSRFPYGTQRGRTDDVDLSPRAICARAQNLTAEDVIARHGGTEWPASHDVVKRELEATERLFGHAPPIGELMDAVGEAPGARVLEKWLFEWERDTDLSPTVELGLDWYTPHPSDGPRLLLLPTPVGWEVPAYLSFHGAEGPGNAERFIAVLRDWNAWFDAELAVHYGTMLGFLVEHPPEFLEEAWGLAWDHEFAASSTRVGISVRHYARALLGRRTWWLHDRP